MATDKEGEDLLVFGGSFLGVLERMGCEEHSLGYVKSEMRIRHLRGDSKFSFRSMSLDFRGKL